MTRNVLVIGLGLIGGSLALALQKSPKQKWLAMIYPKRRENWPTR